MASRALPPQVSIHLEPPRVRTLTCLFSMVVDVSFLVRKVCRMSRNQRYSSEYLVPLCVAVLSLEPRGATSIILV